MIRQIWIVVWALCISGLVAADHGPQTWTGAHQSVVSVLPTWPGYQRPGLGAPPGVAPEGSGFYWSPTKGLSVWVLTAAHVVDRASEVHVRLADGQIVPATIMGSDPHTDIALLRLTTEGPSVQWNEVRPVVGTHVCALGNAFGLGVSLTCGVVSQSQVKNIGFNAVEDFIQTDTAVNPGASGGALVGSDGRLLGMLSAIFTKQSDANTGVNFAISTELLVSVARRLLTEYSSENTMTPMP